MSKLFYDHLIIIEEVILVLAKHNITPKEREELIELVDQNMHSAILDTILKHLPADHHEEFLIKFHAAPYDKKLLGFLKEKTTVDIEKEILLVANKVKKKVLAEIVSAKEG